MGRDVAARDSVERDVAERDEAERDEAERDDAEREPDERPVVECERVPRRVDSLELTVRPPQSSLSDRTHPMVIHLPQQHRHPLCRPWQQLLLQWLQEH